MLVALVVTDNVADDDDDGDTAWRLRIIHHRSQSHATHLFPTGSYN